MEEKTELQYCKELKIMTYVIIVLVGLQFGFTFKKLNMMEDKMKSISMKLDNLELMTLSK